MMKFKNHIFFMLGLASVFSMGTFDAMCATSANAGYFCKGSTTHKCRKGCYCLGGGCKSFTLNVDAACKNRWTNSNPENLGIGINYCPSTHPSSDETAKTKYECYKEENGARVYYSDNDGGGTYSVKDCTRDIAAGKYCEKYGTVNKCKSGCICDGGIKRGIGDKYVDASGALKDLTLSWWCEHKGEFLKNHLEASGVHYCPDDFPKSEEGQSNFNKCYFLENGLAIYADTTIQVAPGKYLPKGSTSPTSCPSDKYCPGGTYAPSAAKDVGYYTCTEGEVSNDNTKCVITCVPGTYYAWTSSSCKSCTAFTDKYCPDTTTVTLSGGSKHRIDRGLKDCPTGQHPSTDRKSCESDEDDDTSDTGGNNGGETGNSGSGANDVVADITIDAGYYLPAGKTKHSEQKLCYGTTNFCPGGVFSTEDFDQGIYECPGNGRAANDKKSCNISLSKEELKSGFARVSDCWLLTDRNDFMECVFGGELYNVSNGSSNGGTAYIEKSVADYQNKTVLSDAVMQVEKGKKDNDDKSLKVNNNTRYDISAGADVTQMKKPDFVSKEPITQKKITTSQSDNATTTTASKVDSTAASFKSVRSVRKR